MSRSTGIAASAFAPLGRWLPDGGSPAEGADAFRDAVGKLTGPVVVVETDRGLGVASGGRVELGSAASGLPVVAYLPPLPARQLLHLCL